jgi:molecular chaperone DnaK
MRIKLKYPDVDTFLKKYGHNLSEDSVFIVTKSFKPVGTPLRFEFVLVTDAGDQPVFRGEGTVATVREEPAGPSKPQGMTVRFSRLFGDGAQLVARARDARPRRATNPPPPPPVEPPPPPEELSSAREISSGEFQALHPPVEPELPAPSPEPTERIELPPATPPAATNHEAAARPPLVDVDALAREWQISPERVDEILHRRRPRDPALAAELEGLLASPAPPSVTAAEATARLAQLLDRRRKPR